MNEVRELTEQLRILGYQKCHLIWHLSSRHGSFNGFKVMADILIWLAAKFDFGTGNLSAGDLDNESDRVALIRNSVEFMFRSCSIKLNPIKLYSGSFSSATELLKITKVLINLPRKYEVNDNEIPIMSDIDIDDKVNELRMGRLLSSELIKHGATIYDLLKKEMSNNLLRHTNSHKNFDITAIEQLVLNETRTMQNKIVSIKKEVDAHKNEINNLSGKLQRKLGDLERSTQRLNTLQKIKPAYIEEYERFETDLKQLFNQYFIRARCLEALKFQQLNRFKMTNAPLQMQSTKMESSMNLLPDGLIDSDEDDLTDDKDNEIDLNLGNSTDSTQKLGRDPIGLRSPRKLRIRTGAQNKNMERILGSMNGLNLSEDDSEGSLSIKDDDGHKIDFNLAPRNIPDDDDEDSSDDMNDFQTLLKNDTGIKSITKPERLSDEEF